MPARILLFSRKISIFKLRHRRIRVSHKCRRKSMSLLSRIHEQADEILQSPQRTAILWDASQARALRPVVTMDPKDVLSRAEALEYGTAEVAHAGRASSVSGSLVAAWQEQVDERGLALVLQSPNTIERRSTCKVRLPVGRAVDCVCVSQLFYIRRQGVLLQKLERDFWEACRDGDVAKVKAMTSTDPRPAPPPHICRVPSLYIYMHTFHAQYAWCLLICIAETCSRRKARAEHSH